jgi:hypothetical protein
MPFYWMPCDCRSLPSLLSRAPSCIQGLQLFVAYFSAMVEPFFAEQCMVLNERCLLLQPWQFMEYIRQPFVNDNDAYARATRYGFDVLYRDSHPRPIIEGSVRVDSDWPPRQVIVPFQWTCGSQSVFPVQKFAFEHLVNWEADSRIFRPAGFQGEDPAMSLSSSDCDTEAARISDGVDERDDPTNSTSTSSLLESDAA